MTEIITLINKIVQHYPERHREDLIQECIILYFDLKEEHGENEQYLTKAFFNLCSRYCVNERTYTDFSPSVDLSGANIDQKIDAEAFLNNIENKKHRKVIEMLTEGYAVEEIAAALEYSTPNIYKIIKTYSNGRR